ncbi:hypothetical protein [Devosia sp. SD17-2]|uniref:hypothetical protein n=1 Tax=Devosia sp. SD17-2 TaxID=2976459 RepID=UPI0023D80AE6|nr:hypothetical protein [Devosia sp. SD17-2]WEJ31699.1 hypothetical protein NYQ88_12370 [Devosia sp. SD17-2]
MSIAIAVYDGSLVVDEIVGRAPEFPQRPIWTNQDLRQSPSGAAGDDGQSFAARLGVY